MRFPEDKIKEAILHTDLDMRDRATSYFAKSYSDDVSIMAQVIKAVETYGRHDAYRLMGPSRDLPQTAESIAWVIDELNHGQSDTYENYTYNLSMVLVEADIALLLSKESAVMEARCFLPDLRPAIDDRLRMLPWDEATCWRKLEEFCEDGKSKQYTNEVNLGHANRIVEALARNGQGCEGKVHALLSEKVEDYRQSPMKWMEPLAVRLAGQTHLDSTIPLLIAKLQEDGGDLLNEECSEALTRIGTPAVLHAVAETFPKAKRHFRLYATTPLEHIHSDLAVETCLHLLGQERDEMIQGNLAQALLSQFAPDGIDVARRLLLSRELDFESRGLRAYLLETCTLMGERFPEYEEWLAAEKAEKEEHWKRVKELEGDPKGMLLFALEKLTGKKATDVPRAKPRLPQMPQLTLPRQPAKKRRVGRNDPCPCGSGKKYKQCCLPKEVAAHRSRPSPTITDPHGKPKKRPEYPIGTVALYGPNDKITTKIAASVIKSPSAEPILERWVATDVTTSPKVQREIKEFFERHGVKSIAMSEGNMGCPHEEGEDFPDGEDCPFCPFWAGKQGSNRRD